MTSNSVKLKALEYLYLANLSYNGDKEQMLDACKRNLSVLESEDQIGCMIEAIKILKKNLTIKLITK